MPSLSPAALLAPGERLRSLREEGILVIRSGAMAHSLGVFRRPELAGRTAAFGEWATDALARRDVETLIDHRREGPGADVSRATPPALRSLAADRGASVTTGRTATSGVDGTWFGNWVRSLRMV